MPPGGRFLLDTNVVIALLEGDSTVLVMLDSASEVFIPAIVLGELFFGATKSARHAENVARVERFAAGRSIILVPQDRHFDEVEGLPTEDWFASR